MQTTATSAGSPTSFAAKILDFRLELPQPGNEANNTEPTMKKLIVLAVFGFAMLLASPSGTAQKIDLATTKCKQVSEMNKDAALLLMMWLIGYHTDEDEADELNLDYARELAGKIMKFCGQNPTFNIGAAADGILSK